MKSRKLIPQHSVAWIYRNVICPWQTPKDIQSAEKFCAKIWNSLRVDERIAVFRLKEERDWFSC